MVRLCAAIILDSGGVVVRPNPVLVAYAASTLGISVPAHQVVESVHRTDAQIFYGCGTGFAELFGDLLVPSDAERHRIWDLANAMFGPLLLWSEVNPEARPFLSQLPTQAKRSVVTNSEGTAREEITAVGLSDLVGPIFDSELVGVCKPDPQIFQMCAAALSVDLLDCLYLSDTLDAPPELFGTFVLYDPFSCYDSGLLPKGVVRVIRLTQVLDLIGQPA
jgi:beta-phosphoglucomutase-like phosphatase (HAD superfamily)